MDSTALVQFIPLLFFYALTVVPAFVILGRTGMSRWLGLLLIIPMFGLIIVLWVIAFAQWSPRPQPLS